MNKLIFTLTILFSVHSQAADCGIKPRGMEFGPGCELIRVPAPAAKKTTHGSPLEAPPTPRPAPAKNRIWEPILFGAYSGKIGFYAMIGKGQDLKVDALLMNEDVVEKAYKATQNLKLGGLIACEAVGLQQSIGYTLFDLRNCSGKN